VPLQVLAFDCDQHACPAHATRQCVAPEVWRPADQDPNDPVDVLLVSWSPTGTEAGTARAFSGDAGQLVRRILRLEGLPAGGYACTSVVRCRQHDADQHVVAPGPQEVQACREHLARDLERLKPKVIVMMGPEVGQVMLPAERHANNRYGRVHRVKVAGHSCWAVQSVGLDMVAQYSALLTGLRDVLLKAKDLAARDTESIHCPDRWQVETKIRYCDTVDKVGRMVDYLLHKTTPDQVCAFDVETRNLNARHGNQLVTLQFCVDPTVAYVVPYQYQYGPFFEDDLPRVRDLLARLFTEKPGFGLWGTHNGSFEQSQVQQFILDGKTFRNAPMVDTMGDAYMLDENRARSYKLLGQGLSLKDLTAELLGRDTYQATALQARAAGELYRLKPEELIPYAADDVVHTLMLRRYFTEIAAREQYGEAFEKLSRELFGPTFRLCSKLKRNGVYVDLPHLRDLVSPDSPLLKRRAELDATIRASPHVKAANKKIVAANTGNQRALYGEAWHFNHNKPAHKQTLFCDVMGLEPLAFGTNGPAIDKEFFDAYGEYDEVKWIQEDTSIKKLSTSYGNQIIEYVDPSYGNLDCSTDSRVRPDFGFVKTVTGRFACEGPNTQNVPRADNWAKASIKSMYCAPQSYGPWRPGKPVERVLLQLDYMANEVRWLAVLSQDTLLGEALRRGKEARDRFRRNPTPENAKIAKLAGDIHTQTAALMFGIAPEKVTKDLRQITKSIVFAIVYGGGPKLIAAKIKKTDLEEVKQLIRKFERTVPDANKWLKWIEKFADENLYVESPIGRRRRLFEFLTEDDGEVAGARRVARNAPIQGVASDACLVGAALWMDWIEDHDRDWTITNVVHDSCVTEVPIDDLREAIDQAEKCFTVRMMRKLKDLWGVKFICPLEVEFEVGVRWGEMRKLELHEADTAAAIEWLRAGGVKQFDHK
jgi:uracil-DNA glycosylase family 4